MEGPREFIEYLPVEARDGGFIALGVRIRCDSGRLSDWQYLDVCNALDAKAKAEGRNMSVALAYDAAWLHACRQCQAPFIALPTMKLCSDACRIKAKRDAVARFRAKRVERGWREPRGEGRFVCDQCGRLNWGRSRPTKRFCTVACRVAAHRGVRPQPMDEEALDHLISQIEQFLFTGVAVEFPHLALTYGRRLSNLKAERAKL